MADESGEILCTTHQKPLQNCEHRHWLHLVEDSQGGEVPPTPEYEAAQATSAAVKN